MKRFLWMLLLLFGITHTMTAWGQSQFLVQFADGTERLYTLGALAQDIGKASAQQLSPVTITLIDNVEGSVEFFSSIRAHIIIDLNGKTWASSEGGGRDYEFRWSHDDL